MKRRDVLVGIAGRASQVEPLEPTSKNVSFNGETDDFDTMFFALRKGFPGLYMGKDEIEGSELEQFDALFAWLAQQLCTFPSGTISPQRHLTKLLALATLLEHESQLWDELAKAIPSVSPLLVDSFARVLTECRIDGQKALKRACISDAHIGNALADIAHKDWRSVEWVVEHLSGILWSAAKRHASIALYRFDRSRLESVLEREDDLFEITSFVLHVPAAQSLQLALTTGNWTLKFWALHASALGAARRGSSYPQEWQVLLSQAAAVPTEWIRWLAVLNEYPSRYPQLQEALGMALVGASAEVMEAYVASVSDASDFGRQPVADALSVFRQKAPLADRKRLWTAAFRRWKQWDFGCAEESKSLFRVARSPFDFPVIGYLTECLSAMQRTEMVAALQDRAAAMEQDWHVDLTPAISERFKLISEYQLLAHAEAVAMGEPAWLAGEQLYRPAWEDGTPYRRLKYDLGNSTF